MAKDFAWSHWRQIQTYRQQQLLANGGIVPAAAIEGMRRALSPITTNIGLITQLNGSDRPVYSSFRKVLLSVLFSITRY